MKKLFFLALFCFSRVVAADPAAQALLYEKMVDMEFSQGGMCDGMRTALIVHRSKNGRMAHEFIGFSGTRYIVVQDTDEVTYAKEYYFTKKYDDVVKNDTPMDWGVPLTQDGPNFFWYHFFPDRPNDCGLSQPMK